MSVPEMLGVIVGASVIIWPIYNAVFWFFESGAELPWNWRTLIGYDYYMNWLEKKEED